MIISVVGIGYVGLSNAIILAQKNKVLAVDIDQNKIDSINKKISPIVDNEIQDYLSNVDLDLIATNDAKSAFCQSDLVLIATPTNYDSKTNKFDTSSVEQVIKNVKKVNPNCWIVIKSTVGVGFTKKIIENVGYSKIIFSPEFLREGKALYDNLYPSRIIVGIPEKTDIYIEKANEFLMLLKNGALKENVETLVMGSTEAEAVKLFSNTYLALRVSYFNELDNFAQSKKLDSLDIIKGVCADPRIGNFYNNPSFGYGGYCLPKDTKELRANFDSIPENLISAIVESNRTRKQFIADQILQVCSSKEKNVLIGIFRLTMKSGSDNFRDSAIFGVIKRLQLKGAKIVIYEPTINEKKILDFEVENDLTKFKEISDVIVANRFEKSLCDVKNKVYTRDLFYRD